VSFCLATLILLTTSSFTADTHYCYNKLVDMAFFSKAKICKEKKDFSTKNCSSLQEKNCCSSYTFVKQADTVFETTKNEFESQTIVFLNTFYYTHQNLFEGLEKNIVPFKQYRPPLLTEDIQILHKTYLI
tara:strand:+ start:57 stop:446 length:390 start_codon:yes stop_codon:yes gene_type:complete